MLYPLLFVAAVAAAPVQTVVDVRSPSDAFLSSYTKGDSQAALALIEPDTIACVKEAGGPDAGNDALAPCVLLLAYYGSTLGNVGQAERGVSISRKATELAADFGAASEIAMLTNLFYGLVLERQGRHQEAAAPFTQALAAAEHVLGEVPGLAAYLARRANNLIALGQFGAALPLADRAVALAGDSAEGNFYRLMQGTALLKLGRLTEAETALRAGVARLTDLVGEDAPQTTGLREILAMALAEQNRLDEAIPLWRKTLAAQRARGGGAGLDTSLTGLGLALMRAGESREAEALLREALALRLKLFGENSGYAALGYANLGYFLITAGKPDDAARMLTRGLEIFERTGGNVEEVLTVVGNVALALIRLGELSDAAALQRQALTIAETSFGAADARTLLARQNLATTLQSLGQSDAARPLLEANYASAGKLGGAGAELRATAALGLALALEMQGDGAAARRWFALAEQEGRAAFRRAHRRRIEITGSHGTFLLRQPGSLPLARTLLADAAEQVRALGAAGVGNDAQAQHDLRSYSSVFRAQIRAAWGLSRSAR